MLLYHSVVVGSTRVALPFTVVIGDSRLAIVLAFTLIIGALIVIRPGSGLIGWAALLPLAALAQSLGRAVQLQVEAGTPQDSPARRDAAERARRQAEAEQIIADDPLVKALMAQYKTARIVPGSVKPH